MNKSELQGFDVSRFSAAVIGCGGLGCSVAVHLAGAGIGELYLIDFDTVSQSNLNRQFLYTKKDCEKSKVLTAEKRIKAYAPDTMVYGISDKITKTEDLDFALNCDIIFSAVDSNETRKIITDFCTRNKIPLVIGGINGFSGYVYLYVPGKSPCPECAGLLGNDTRHIVSVSTTAGIIGAMQVETGINHLTELTEDESGILRIYDFGEISKLKIKSQKNCGICGVNKNVRT